MPREESGRMPDRVLIQLRPQAAHGLERIIRAIEEMNGRVLLSFPPSAIVAVLASPGIERLRNEPDVMAVDAGEIAEERLKAASGTARAVMATWNAYLARQQAHPKPPSADLAWDAPGRQPPDPPLHIREMLRQREREIHDGNDRPLA